MYLHPSCTKRNKGILSLISSGDGAISFFAKDCFLIKHLHNWVHLLSVSSCKASAYPNLSTINCPQSPATLPRTSALHQGTSWPDAGHTGHQLAQVLTKNFL